MTKTAGTNSACAWRCNYFGDAQKLVVPERDFLRNGMARERPDKVTEHSLQPLVYGCLPHPDAESGRAANACRNFLLWQIAYAEIFVDRKALADFPTSAVA